jgi:hypothetical protein
MSPLPSIYMPWTTCGGSATPREWTPGPTRDHHVEGQDGPTQGQFGRPLVGPPWHVLLCGGCPVGPHVGSWCPLGFEAVWVPVGPSVHVMSACRPLIRRGLPLLVW